MSNSINDVLHIVVFNFLLQLLQHFLSVVSIAAAANPLFLSMDNTTSRQYSTFKHNTPFHTQNRQSPSHLTTKTVFSKLISLNNFSYIKQTFSTCNLTTLHPSPFSTISSSIACAPNTSNKSKLCRISHCCSYSKSNTSPIAASKLVSPSTSASLFNQFASIETPRHASTVTCIHQASYNLTLIPCPAPTHTTLLQPITIIAITSHILSITQNTTHSQAYYQNI